MIRSTKLAAPHGLFNRLDGVSPAPYSSLNLSFGVGDDPENVAANRLKVKQLLGAVVLASAGQVHGDRVWRVDDLPEDTEMEGYDALVTDRPGIGLLVQQADCQAVLLHDPRKRAIAAVHCGWRGSVLNIIGTTIEQMRREYLSEPADMRAVISPSLGPCCAEFIHYRQELPEEMHSFRSGVNRFDFWKISTAQLTGAGVPEENINIIGICTCCHGAYFSHRRSVKKGMPATGRQGSVILLPP
jgi:polyphenol oxidase